VLCQDLMKSEVECFRTLDSVQEIARRMRDVNVGFVPICDADGRPLGTLTDRDIAIRVCAEGRAAAGVRAGEVMTRETVTCRGSDDVERAEKLMAEHHKSRIMVVNDEGRLVGVISLSDVAEQDGHRAVETLRRVAEREVPVH
jgi:CBS domain-containing protein